jgi:hypothetical protein
MAGIYHAHAIHNYLRSVTLFFLRFLCLFEGIFHS